MSTTDDCSSREAFELHHQQLKQELPNDEDDEEDLGVDMNMDMAREREREGNLNSDTDIAANEAGMSDEIKAVFFNYHEYVVDTFSDDTESEPYKHSIQNTDNTLHSQVLCINHFPSYKSKSRRIVRVPRVSAFPVLFSTYIPGTEPCAIVKDYTFTRSGFYKGEWYNDNSMTPLSLSLSQQDFKEIVLKINELSIDSTTNNVCVNVAIAILDCLSFGICTLLLSLLHYNTYARLDSYIGKLNTDNPIFVENNIRLISPTENGFLSLDFEIERP